MSGKNILKTNEITADKVTVDGIVLPKSNYSASLPPSNSNDGLEGYSAGSIWVDITSDKAYICTDNTTSLAQWTLSTQGVTGIAGNTGIQGATGIIGIAGVTGIQGITGIFGETGVQGIRGEAFSVDEFVDIDEAKLTDIEDNSGATADDIYVVVVAEDNRASQALPAPLNRDISRHAITWDGTSWFDFGPFTGVQGEQGTTGIDGVTGVQGTTGILGIDGVTGIQGTTGILGIDGVTGIQGVTGILGIDGVTGIQGVTGILGIDGVTGIQGVTGIDGVTGIQGVTGILGIDGVTGIQGVTGILGIDGVTGIQGVTGILGIDGIQGETGITGFTGIQGTTGVGTSYEVLLLGEDILAGKACYISVGDTNGDTGRVEGKLYKLDITNEFRMEYCGISAEAKLTDEPANLITSGTASGFSALPKGLPVFASTTTPGDWQADAPIAVGYGIQQLGIGSDVDTELVLNGALSATLVTIQEGVSTDLFVADQIGFVAPFARETDPSGFISAKNKTIGKSTAEYSGDEYKDLYKFIWGLNGVQVEAVATKKGFTVLTASKAAGWETDWDAGVNILIDLRDEFLRFSGDVRGSGNHQDDAIQGHDHDYLKVKDRNQTGSVGSLLYAGSSIEATSGVVADGVNGTPRTADETRSSNTTVNPFIRYKNDTKALIHGEVGTVNQFQTETKILSADHSGSVLIPDLTFTNVTIGEQYTLTFRGYVSNSGGAGDNIGVSVAGAYNVGGTDEPQFWGHVGPQTTTIGGTVEVTAIATEITFTTMSFGTGAFLIAATEQTTAQLTRKTDYATKYIAMEAEEVKKIRSVRSSVEREVGEWVDGSTLYEKSYDLSGETDGTNLIDGSFTTASITPRNEWAKSPTDWLKTLRFWSLSDYSELMIQSNGLYYKSAGNYADASFTIQYTKN